MTDDDSSRAASGGGPAEPAAELIGVSKTFRRANGEMVHPVRNTSLQIRRGELVVLLGPSGCGKTTLLRCLAGLEQPHSGEIRIGADTVFSQRSRIDVPPERRATSMVFQSYAIWPHMTVAENVGYPLIARKLARRERETRVGAALRTVGISSLGDLRPGQLSGGQQQRVALARALVTGDSVLLFDEPLSNVDAKVREQVRTDLVSMQRRLGFAALYVTHDQVEAMELGDRVAVLKNGEIAQIGSPEEVYARPRSQYVARFIGTTNEIDGTVLAVDGDRVRLRTSIGECVGVRGAAGLVPGSSAVGIVRPEQIAISVDEPPSPNRWKGTVEARLFSGSHTVYLVDAVTMRFKVWASRSDIAPNGHEVWISVDPAQLYVLEPEEQPGAEGGLA